VNRKLGAVVGVVILGGLFGFALYLTMWPASGPIAGPPQTKGLPSACTILDPALQERLVPGATASHRTFDRLISECTLTGGGRELTIRINDGIDLAAAKDYYGSLEQGEKLFSRRGLPPLESPALGDQALLAVGYDNTNLIVRKGSRVVQVRYTTRTGVLEVATQLLK
jgi:hypothetical protein